MRPDNTPLSIKLDERQHVEKPFLEQLEAMNWEVFDLDTAQTPGDSLRDSFTEVAMLPILRERLRLLNPWLQSDQVEEVVKRVTASFPSTGLLENNRYIFQMLLEGTSVGENRATGERSPTVRIVDFEVPESNRFTAVCQFKVRILGTEFHIRPDIVLFLNGLPIVLVECKSPKVRDAIPEAIDQILRYSEQRGVTGEGSAKLFYYNQFVIATCRQEANFGTITTHSEKHFFRWADPYPRKLDDLPHGASSPNDQQRLVAGMLDKRNLLDLIRTFTLFSVNDKGQTIKIVGRYQQFRAVKVAVKRLLEGKTPRSRSGIVWHTQGSGKSLTMMFMVRAMYRQPRLSNWKVVFVTDRSQLETQLSETSNAVGYSVKVADSIQSLKELLKSDTSDLVMAMVHKFQESDLRESFPELNRSPNVLVMIDEAHRSQYKLLGANMDRALPNATKIGYTGTPIDKTEQVFGDYIDKYTIRESIDDKVTLEIVYEGRTHNAEIEDQDAADSDFADVFSDYNLRERLQILGYGSREAYLEAESTIAAKAKDMVTHYVDHVFSNGYKGQIVASSREAATRYKVHVDAALASAVTRLEASNPNNLEIERLRSLQSDVIISGRNNDPLYLKQYSNSARHEASIKRFKLPFDAEEGGVRGDMGILIVNNMLLTGFDAPIEQVMYLDKVVVAHNLLQAIARVNRVAGEGKDKGFVVDYVGVGHHLKRAIDSYDEREQKEIIGTLSSPEEELDNLKKAHATVMAFLQSQGLSDLGDHDAFFDVFYDEDLRFQFLEGHRKLTKALNIVLPSQSALDYLADYVALAEVSSLASRHFRDDRISMKGIPDKLRVVADAHLRSKGVDVRVKPISILDEDFERQATQHKRVRTKAAEVEHAIRHHLNVDLGQDPELQASLSEALGSILKNFQDNWDEIYAELELLRERIKRIASEPTYGLHRKKQMPFFRSLRRELYGDAELDEDQVAMLVDLTQQVVLTIESELSLTGFWESIPARNKLGADIQRLLLSERFVHLPGMASKRKQLTARLMEIAEVNTDVIRYAA